ncbi:hypothetical protein GEV33_003871 [Tenebrio molitor]|uniref:Uncharacterized protein n=1 Tax=Tenebrio molitor TaxID=7067 RepID=A0A8J6HHM1_TENMO|nr:hypothetical protein GEV33_003871 [Tenebrio molitor]
MNRQTTGLVLCALLLTTFGHELVNRHQAARSAKKDHAPLDYKREHYHARDHNSEECYSVCESTGNGGSSNLTVIVNTTSSLVAVANVTAKVALVVDVKANLVVVLASSGVLIGVNLETKKALYVPAGSSNATWNGSVSLEDYLGNLTDGLEGLRKVVSEGAKHFNVSNVPEEVSAQVHLILIALSSGEEGNQKEAVAVLVEISVALRAALSVSLKVLRSGSVVVGLTLRAVVNITVGLAKLIGQIKGGVAVLVSARVTIDLNILLGAENAAAVFVSIVAQLAKAGVKLAEALSDILKFESLFALLVELGGNSSKGLNGLIKVVVALVNTLNEGNDPETLIHALIEYYGHGGRQEIGQQWDASIKAILDLVQEYHLEEVAKGLVEVLHKIQENKWTVNHVNLSAAIAILIATKENSVPLDNIVKILNLLGRRSLILVLITVLIRLLTIPGGIRVVISLAPNIKITIDLNVVNALRLLLRRVVIPIVRHNVLRILLTLPIIGDLLRHIQKSLVLRLEELIKHPECGKVIKELLELLNEARKNGGGGTSIGGSASGSGNTSIGGSVSGSGDSNGDGSGDGHVSGGGGGNGHGDNNGGGHGGSGGNGKGDESGSGSNSKESNESGSASGESGGHPHHSDEHGDKSKESKEKTHSRHKGRHQGHARHNKAGKNHKGKKHEHAKHLNEHKQ